MDFQIRPQPSLSGSSFANSRIASESSKVGYVHALTNVAKEVNLKASEVLCPEIPFCPKIPYHPEIPSLSLGKM